MNAVVILNVSIYYNKVVAPVCLFVCLRTPPRALEIGPHNYIYSENT